MSRAWFDAGGASAAVRALPWPYSAALLWSCEQEEHLWSTLQDCYQTAGIRDRYVNPPLVEVSGWPCWHPGAAVRVPGSVLTVSAPPPPGCPASAVRRAPRRLLRFQPSEPEADSNTGSEQASPTTAGSFDLLAVPTPSSTPAPGSPARDKPSGVAIQGDDVSVWTTAPRFRLRGEGRTAQRRNDS